MTLVASLACLSHAALADADLSVRADEAQARILPRENPRQQTRLPSLQFSVRAVFACPDDAVAESITIGVADAYKRYLPEAGDKALEAVITVPGDQIASIAIGEFCVEGNTATEMLLGSVATAQVSLRCRDATGPSVRFASSRLPLRLECQRDEAQDPSVEFPSPAR